MNEGDLLIKMSMMDDGKIISVEHIIPKTVFEFTNHDIEYAGMYASTVYIKLKREIERKRATR
jgi:hypothetical protein